MLRKRTPTAATLKARAKREARRQANAEAMKLKAHDSVSEKRMKLARQIIEAHHDYDDLPSELDPDVLEIARAYKRFPTEELYAMRDRAVNLRKILDRKNPDRERRQPLGDEDLLNMAKAKKNTTHRFFKGTDITAITKPKAFMRILDRLGPIPRDLLSDALYSAVTQPGWAYPEITPDETRYDMVVSAGMRHEWDPPWYTSAGKALGKTDPNEQETLSGRQIKNRLHP